MMYNGVSTFFLLITVYVITGHNASLHQFTNPDSKDQFHMGEVTEYDANANELLEKGNLNIS